ncbi:MAG: c-type cytochrome [Saprospiraceae bacterium]|nr:c-type cytochrome [Saprospiraceae bacterium]
MWNYLRYLNKNRYEKTSLKIALFLLGFLLIGIASLLAYVKFALPNVGQPTDLTVEATPERIARGEYLANHVAVCMQCHSQRDWSVFAAPSKPGTEGVGGEVHDQRLGFPGRYVSKNITPAGLSGWTDGEILRAITCGVDKQGNALFPIMPYPNYGQLDEQDIHGIIAYIRTLAPKEFVAEKSTSDFPMNFIINTIPAKPKFSPRPDASDKVAYGKYLVTAAICIECHTKSENGAYTGKPFAGGMEFPLEDGSVVRSSNITPHATGIGNWSSAQFVQRFKMYTDSSYTAPKVQTGDFQTVMPWDSYSGMTESDLLAIYEYLKTLEPVEGTVERFTAVASN